MNLSDKHFDFFMLTVIAVALIIVIFRIRKFVKLYLYTKNWPSVKGVITESSIVSNYIADYEVKYTYIVKDQEFEGNTPRLFSNMFITNSAQTKFVKQYSPGKEVQVFYNPSNARNSYLLRSGLSGVIIDLAIPCVALIGWFIFLLIKYV